MSATDGYHCSLLFAAGLLCCSWGCGSGTPRSEPPAPSEPPTVVTVNAPPSEAPTDEPEVGLDEPPVSEPAADDVSSESSIGIAECDEYLAVYRRCEPRLADDIAKGERRSYRAEHGWLQYVTATPEVAELPEACRQMLSEIRPLCSP